MASLTQIDWSSLANESGVKALLEDLIGYYKGIYQGQQLALAVWFRKSPQEPEHSVLALFTGPPTGIIAGPDRQSLLWKMGLDHAPFAKIYWASIADFSNLIISMPDSLPQYHQRHEVIYFNNRIPLPKDILEFFGITTEPPGLIKLWCLGDDQYFKGQTVESLLAGCGGIRPDTGLVKTWESEDFENCRGLLHVPFLQRWVPSTPGGIGNHGFYSDWKRGHPGYFLAEGGAFYRIVKFEVIYAPEYAELVLEKLPDDRYPEVYLRAVSLPEQSAA